MANKDIPNMEQVKEFLKNANDTHLKEIKAFISNRENAALQRATQLKDLILDLYPELSSLMQRNKKLIALRIVKDLGFTNAEGTLSSFNMVEVKTAMELEFGLTPTETEECKCNAFDGTAECNVHAPF